MRNEKDLLLSVINPLASPTGSRFQKSIAFIVTASLLYTTVATPLAEANFWAERRSHSERVAPKDNTQMASLPAAAADPSQIVRNIAGLPSSALSSALSSQLRESLPRHLSQDQSALLSSLPYAFGQVRKIAVPENAPSGKTIIHIQDVHRNAEAQANIAGAVRELSAQGKVGLVALEGAFAPFDFRRFRAFPHPDSVKDVADFLLERFEISGPVHAALTGPGEIPAYVGIDDKAHYDANVDAYIRSAPRRDALEKKLSALVADLKDQKARTLNQDLAAFDAKVEAYRRHELPLGDYVRLFSSESASASPNLRNFQSALAMESAMDFKRVETERAELIQKLVQRISRDDVAELTNMSVAYRLGQVRYSDFYRRLQALCRKYGLSLDDTPAMRSYIEYVLLSESIDAAKLMSDLESLEKRTYDRLTHGPAERDLIARAKSLHLLGKLLAFSLTPPEWSEYAALSARQAFGPDAGDLDSFEAFYREADARNEAITDNVLKAMDANKSPVAVLVTGGYHSEGVEELMRRRGVLFVTYAPKITRVDTAQGSAYLSVFAREKTPLEKLVEGEKLFLAEAPLAAAVEVKARFGMAANAALSKMGLKMEDARALTEIQKLTIRVKDGVATVVARVKNVRMTQEYSPRRAERYSPMTVEYLWWGALSGMTVSTAMVVLFKTSVATAFLGGVSFGFFAAFFAWIAFNGIPNFNFPWGGLATEGVGFDKVVPSVNANQKPVEKNFRQNAFLAAMAGSSPVARGRYSNPDEIPKNFYLVDIIIMRDEMLEEVEKGDPASSRYVFANIKFEDVQKYINAITNAAISIGRDPNAPVSTFVADLKGEQGKSKRYGPAKYAEKIKLLQFILICLRNAWELKVAWENDGVAVVTNSNVNNLPLLFTQWMNRKYGLNLSKGVLAIAGAVGLGLEVWGLRHFSLMAQATPVFWVTVLVWLGIGAYAALHLPLKRLAAGKQSSFKLSDLSPFLLLIYPALASIFGDPVLGVTLAMVFHIVYDLIVTKVFGLLERKSQPIVKVKERQNDAALLNGWMGEIHKLLGGEATEWTENVDEVAAAINESLTEYGVAVDGFIGYSLSLTGFGGGLSIIRYGDRVSLMSFQPNERVKREKTYLLEDMVRDPLLAPLAIVLEEKKPMTFFVRVVRAWALGEEFYPFTHEWGSPIAENTFANSVFTSSTLIPMTEDAYKLFLWELYLLTYLSGSMVEQPEYDPSSLVPLLASHMEVHSLTKGENPLTDSLLALEGVQDGMSYARLALPRQGMQDVNEYFFIFDENGQLFVTYAGNETPVQIFSNALENLPFLQALNEALTQGPFSLQGLPYFWTAAMQEVAARPEVNGTGKWAIFRNGVIEPLMNLRFEVRNAGIDADLVLPREDESSPMTLNRGSGRIALFIDEESLLEALVGQIVNQVFQGGGVRVNMDLYRWLTGALITALDEDSGEAGPKKVVIEVSQAPASDAAADVMKVQLETVTKQNAACNSIKDLLISSLLSALTILSALPEFQEPKNKPEDYTGENWGIYFDRGNRLSQQAKRIENKKENVRVITEHDELDRFVRWNPKNEILTINTASSNLNIGSTPRSILDSVVFRIVNDWVGITASTDGRFMRMLRDALAQAMAPKLKEAAEKAAPAASWFQNPLYRSSAAWGVEYVVPLLVTWGFGLAVLTSNIAIPAFMLNMVFALAFWLPHGRLGFKVLFRLEVLGMTVAYAILGPAQEFALVLLLFHAFLNARMIVLEDWTPVVVARSVVQYESSVQALVAQVNRSGEDLTEVQRKAIAAELTALIDSTSSKLGVSQGAFGTNPLLDIVKEMGGRSPAQQSIFRFLVRVGLGLSSKARFAVKTGNAIVQAEENEENKSSLAPALQAQNANFIAISPSWSKASVQRMIKGAMQGLSDRAIHVFVNDDKMAGWVREVFGGQNIDVQVRKDYFRVEKGVPVLNASMLWLEHLKPASDQGAQVGLFITSGLDIYYGMTDSDLQAFKDNISLYILNELLNTMKIVKENFEEQLKALRSIYQSA